VNHATQTTRVFRWRRLATAAAARTLVTIAALLAALAVVAPARADFQYAQPLRNQKNEDFCIGIDGASTKSGARTGLFSPCVGTNNQAYQFLGSVHDTLIKVNNGTGYCLIVSSTWNTEGSRDIYQAPCDWNNPRAHWKLTNFQQYSAPNAPRMASIKSLYAEGSCIGVDGGAILNGNEVKAYGCGNTQYGNGNWVVNPNYRPLW